MSKKTGLLRRAAAVAAFSGVAIALTAGTATAAPATATAAPAAVSVASSDLSPSTQKAWDDFILGGGLVAGGAAQMVSAAWVGAPGLIISGASGSPLTPAEIKAWEDWNEGGEKIGTGAALLVSGAYIGAPGYIYDKIAAGATPGDLSPAELDQVSFLIPEDSPALEDIPTEQIPNPLAPFGAF